MDEYTESPDQSDQRQWCVWGSSSAYLVSPFIDTIAKKHKYKYINGAQNGEWGNHTVARLGARPFTIQVPSKIIPSKSLGSITVEVTNSFPRAAMRKFCGVLNGVRGTLSSSATEFTFTRSEPGEAKPCPGDYIFTPDKSPKSESDIVMIWVGKNDLNAKQHVINNENTIVDLTVSAAKWACSVTPQVAVLGHFANSETYKTAPELFAKIQYINAAYASIFGENYFDVPGYLYSSQVWSEAEIGPTQADLVNQSNNCLPVGLARDHGAHLNDQANTALANFIEKQTRRLGWI